MNKEHMLQRAIGPMTAFAALTFTVLALAMAPAFADAGWDRAITAARTAAAEGDYRQAQRRLNTALQRAETFGSMDWRTAGTLFNLGQVQLARGEFAAARTNLAEAITHYERLFGDRSAPLVAAYVSSGHLARADADTVQARERFNTALQLARANKNGAEAPALLGLVQLALETGALTSARERLNAAAEIADKTDDNALRGSVALLESRLARTLGERAAAENAVTKGLAAAKDNKQLGPLQATLLHERGLIAAEWGQPLAALSAFKTALNAWEASAKEHQGIVHTLLELAYAYSVVGNSREADAALQRAQDKADGIVSNAHPLRAKLGTVRTAITPSFQAPRPQPARRPPQAATVTPNAINEQADNGADNGAEATPLAAQAERLKIPTLPNARTLLALGRANALLGDFKAAAAITAQAKERLAQAELSRHPLYLEAQVGQAVYLMRDGSVDAPAAVEGALAAARYSVTRGAGSSTALADALSASAHELQNRGLHVEANERFLEALTLTKELVGESSLRYASLLLAQGRLQMEAGHSHSAQKTLATALETARKVLTSRSPRLLPFVVGVARGHLASGKTAEAANVLRQVRAAVASSKQQGPVVADWALVNAESELARGRYEEARKHLARALDGLADWPANAEIERLATRVQRTEADLFIRMGAIDKALAALPPSPPNDPEAATGWTQAMATTLIAAGQSADALATLERHKGEADDRLLTLKALATAQTESLSDAIAIQRESAQQAAERFTDAHPRTLSAKLVLLRLLRRAGRLDEARAMHDEIAPAYQALFGSEHPALVAVQFENALLAQARTRYAQAAQQLAQTQALAKKYLSASDPYLITLIVNRAKALSDAGQTSAAQNLLTRISNDVQRSVGTSHPLYASIQLALCGITLQTGDRKAATLALKAAEPTIETLPAKHPIRTKALLAEARLALAAGNLRLAKQLAAQALEQSEMADAVDALQAASLAAIVTAAIGNAAEAERFTASALRLVDAKLAGSHSHFAQLALTRATVLQAGARSGEAKAVLRAAIGHLPPEDANRLRLEVALTTTLTNSGHLAQALELAKQTAQTAQRRFSADHPLTASAQLALGSALLEAGRFEESETALNLARNAKEQGGANQHPDLLATRLNLAELYRRSGRVSAATQLLQRTLARLGPSPAAPSSVEPSPIDTGKLQLALARLRRAEGRLNEADTLFTAAQEQQSVAEISALAATAGLAQISMDRNNPALAQKHAEAVLAADDGSAINTQPAAAAHNILSRLALQTGNPDEATAAFDAARDRITTLYSSGHPLAVRQLLDEARIWLSYAVTPQALEAGERALNALRELYGDTHPLALDGAMTVAMARLQGGDAPGARQILDSLAALASTAPDNIKASLFMSAGALHQFTGDLEHAATALEQGVALSEQIYGSKHPLYAGRLTQLATALNALERAREAESILLRALGIYASTLGRSHPALIDTLGELGNAGIKLRKYSAASEHIERQIALIESRHSTTHPRLITPLTNLASLRIETRARPAAIGLLRRAAEIANANDAPLLTSAQALSRLAAVLVEVGQYEKAERSYSDALAIFERLLEQGDARVTATLKSLAALTLRRGDYPGAQLLLQRVAAG
ncbi:MAG: tetratricopeptide repeat protein [Gammaproteobacteria bacterium]|nr:tetratricopeptide repeat protein [Gammaproteobacteria bacterium]